MNSIWSKNFSAFQKRFPQLVKLLGDIPPEPQKFWDIIQAKNGQITANEMTLHLHSSYNPEREACGAIASSEIWEKSTTVFYGFGLGYHVIEWVKKANKQKLVLIEPDVKHFYGALTLLDWTSVFDYENLVIAVGCPAESVLPLIENTEKVNIGNTGVSDAFFFDIPAFQIHGKEYFDAVKTIIKRNQRKNEINAATLKKFGKLWCRNSVKNLHFLTKSSGVSCVKNAADETMPFLILGAGPSLENILPHLAELKKKTVIVCVETALWALLRQNIEPDFIIITDPQYLAYKHIAGLSAPESILITEISTYPAVFRFNCKKQILCSSQLPIGQWFEKELQLDLGDLGTGGSVASSAWNFAYYCGAKQIYVAGLDFAFPGKQTHIKGSSAEQTYHTISNRISASDKFTAGAMFSANATKGKDFNGNPVVTDSRMKMFAWWFESRLAACSDSKTYTLSPKGLCTPGMEPVGISHILQKPDLGKRKSDFISIVLDSKAAVGKDKEKQFEKLIRNFPSEDFINEFPFLKEYL